MLTGSPWTPANFNGLMHSPQSVAILAQAPHRRCLENAALVSRFRKSWSVARRDTTGASRTRTHWCPPIRLAHVSTGPACTHKTSGQSHRTCSKVPRHATLVGSSRVLSIGPMQAASFASRSLWQPPKHARQSGRGSIASHSEVRVAARTSLPRIIGVWVGRRAKFAKLRDGTSQHESIIKLKQVNNEEDDGIQSRGPNSMFCS